MSVREVPVRLPKMSMTMTEGEVVGWSVQPGDWINAGDTVCEVLTDKVDMEVEAPVSGRLARIAVGAGVARVGDPIGWIETEDEDVLGGLFDEPDEPAAPAEPAQPAAPAAPTPAAPIPAARREPAPPDVRREPAPSRRGPVAAVPRARALAKRQAIDLAGIAGSGPGGRVLVGDIDALTPNRRRDETLRAATTRTMTASAAIPQLTVWRDLDLEPVAAARGELSWTTVFLRAYARALRRVPALLVAWDGRRVHPEGSSGTGVVTVALAVHTPVGVVAPAFTDPDRTDPRLLDADIRATVASARMRRIDTAHLRPAIATLVNLGPTGADRCQTLVQPPQASVLATGDIGWHPVATSEGGLGLGLRVSAGLTVDHRAADGVDGARLLAAVSAALLDPTRLLGPA